MLPQFGPRVITTPPNPPLFNLWHQRTPSGWPCFHIVRCTRARDCGETAHRIHCPHARRPPTHACAMPAACTVQNDPANDPIALYVCMTATPPLADCSFARYALNAMCDSSHATHCRCRFRVIVQLDERRPRLLRPVWYVHIASTHDEAAGVETK